MAQDNTPEKKENHYRNSEFKRNRRKDGLYVGSRLYFRAMGRKGWG